MSDPAAPGMVGGVEIRIVLDRLDPPEGHLQVTSGAGREQDEMAEVSFAGWLGLLRALSLVTGSS
jgi:hypothetical protein